jgi:4-hydroxy-tetrahydrodipicolinate reductase
MIKVAVLGAKGRMGQTVVDAVSKADGLELVSQLDDGDAITADSLNGAQVAVDFTVPTATEANVSAFIDLGVNAVVGTTGWNDESLARIGSQLEAANAGREQGHQIGVLIAPNFAFSAVLAMKFAALAAPFFESAEVIELHHPNKVDAPSGTAKSTAAGIAEARRAAGTTTPMPDATETGWEARGQDIDGVRVHAVRLRGLVAHEEIVMGNAGEMLTIRTDSFDRISFMPGVLHAVREVGSHPGLAFGLEKFLPNL